MAPHDTQSPPKLVVRRLVHAKREVVFDAWSNPEKMKCWLFPGAGRARTTNDLRIGGHYDHDMITETEHHECEGGVVTDDGVVYRHTGEYLEILRPEKLVFTWSSPAVSNSRVTVELFERGDDTEVVLTHELLDTEKLRESHSEGWEGCLANLATYLG